ncbi:MAG: hypothetical protein ACR2J3_00105 [Aridibacter sp.]
MKQVTIISIFILLIAITAFAQTDEKSNCPTIDITPPPYAIQPGESMRFSVKFDKKLEQSNLKLLWTVDKEEIIEGQGTRELLVSTVGLNDETINAVIKIEGLPENCINSFSEVGIVAGGPQCECFIDDFGDIPNDDIKARLDNFFIRLQGDPTATGYIESWGSKRDVSKLEKLVNQHIQDRGFDKTRIVLVKSEIENEIRTRFGMIPLGVDVTEYIESLAKPKDKK